jgi:hypothetical protein
MATPNPSYSLSLNYRDRSGEPTTVQLPADAPIDLDTVPTAVSDLVTAIGTASDLLLTAYTATTRRNLEEVTLGGGQREIGFRVFFQDAVTFAKYTTTIGGLKPSLIATLPTGTDYFNIDDIASVWPNFVTKFEAAVLSVDGNAVHVTKIKFVGRSN